MPPVRTLLVRAARIAITVLVLIAAVFAGRRLWIHYQVDPWTRDGRIRADVVQIAPDVAGLVTQVAVTNDQPVRRGQVLFHVDRDRYAVALRQADAALAGARTALAEARREARRDAGLGELVAQETAEQSRSKADMAEASLAQATAARDMAVLNLARTVVTAPTDGTLSDMTLHPGDYVTTGRPVMALIDANSFRVEGYFEETKLPGLRIGQAVSIKVMGEPKILHGHIQSIAAGIEDRDRGPASSLLPNVNPTFSWVRLAQRVPVRIALDPPPPGVRLISGRTATVSVINPPGRRTGGQGR